MERASEALAQMDYLHAETLCLKALRQAREAEDWAYYVRILLPLQEARRQRRMIAADGVIRLGTARLEGPVDRWLASMEAGCIVVTHPHTAEDARTLENEARNQHRYVEVLFAENRPEEERWTLRRFTARPCLVFPVVWRPRRAPGRTPGSRPVISPRSSKATPPSRAMSAMMSAVMSAMMAQ